MFQSCYDEGFIPCIWKDANITALHKKGDKLDPKNYRPISLTSIVSKCFEKVLRNHILSHVESYIVKQQHGFRSGRSCLSNLLDCMYHANGMIDEDCEIDLIYLDFMKAFDSVPHKRLLSKLASYGIKGKTLDIINAFLCNRQFVVRIGDTTSKSYKVRSGVPQGTILGPLLFLIYINDLPDGIGCFSLLFADDLKLLIKKSKRTVAQKDLDYLMEWQNRWLL